MRNGSTVLLGTIPVNIDLLRSDLVRFWTGFSDPEPEMHVLGCNRSELFDANYYQTGCGIPYERNDHWLNTFGLIADEIIRAIQPRTVFDAGCALGFLVEALWDRGVEARGVDLSSFAISQVRPDMRPYCRIASVADSIQGRYDLVTCIEVLEHILPEETATAIANLTSVTDTILFSSTSSDFNEPTHVNVRPVIDWLKLFAASGFWPDCIFDASFVAPHAILFRRQEALPDEVLVLFSQFVRIKCALVEREQRIGTLNRSAAELRDQLERTGAEMAGFVNKNAEMSGLIGNLSKALSEVRSELAEAVELHTRTSEERDRIAAELLSARQHSEPASALNGPEDSSKESATAAQTDTLTWQTKAAAMETEAVRLRAELSGVYGSPAWRMITRYRGWLADQRRKSRWIRTYERGVNWVLRRGRLVSHEIPTPIATVDGPPLDSAPSGVQNAQPVFESYESWITRSEPGPQQLKFQAILSRRLRLQPLFSVIVPVYKVPLAIVRDMVESVLAQTYHNWQLCISHGDVDDNETRAYLTSLAERDPRIRVVLLERNEGIVGNSNAALQVAEGEYIALLDHDDTLAPFALFAIANAINEHPDAVFLYSDKDCLSEDGRSRVRPLFKPQWSPDVMLSVNYLTHLCVMRTDTVRAIGGWRPETEGAQDWDIFLRTIDSGGKVVFVPGVLYHWRIISTSVSSAGLAVKPYAAKGQLQCVNDHAKRVGLRASATIDQTGRLKIEWQGLSEASVTIILVSSSPDPARIDRWAHLIDEASTRWASIQVIARVPTATRVPGRLRWTALALDGPYHEWLNSAVETATGDYVVFLDESVDIGNPDWLTEMVGPLQQPGIGLVGVKTLNPLSRNLRHAGIVFNADGDLDYIFSNEPEHICEQFGSGVWYRNWSAVAGASFAVRRDLFKQVGGFLDWPAYPRHDVDLCLRIGAESGHRIFYNPFAVFLQSGTGLLETWVSGNRSETGAAYIRSYFPCGDPHFHPQLESRAGKVMFAAPKRDMTKLDYGAEARALVGLFDAPPDTIQASKRTTSKPPRNSLRNMTWVVPEFSHAFYGGIHTILRFADYFHRAHGVQSDFVVLGNVPEPIMRGRVATAFPNLAQSAAFTRMRGYDDWDRVRASDATISTLWTTAYAALACRNTRRKFYFVQDYEPLFYPAGSTYALVEATYGFGYYGICNTRPLRDTYQELGGEAEYFDPAIDPGYFFEAEHKPVASEPYTLFCYARPGHPRNCFELLAAALRSLKASMGDSIRIVSAGADWSPYDHGLHGVVENLGLLSYAATGALYRSCDVGVVMMMTRHPSYLPMELMACGALVVTNQNRHTDWLLKNEENCLLTGMSSGAIAAAVERGLRDNALRERITAWAAASVRDDYSDWDKQAEKIYRYMLDKT